MKITSFTRVVAVLAMTAASLVEVVRSTKCQYPNLFIEILERRSHFALFTDPMNQSSKCSPEWQRYGSCCRDEDVMRYGSYKVREYARLIQNRKNEMVNVSKSLATFVERYCDVDATDN